jgi:hypothetical protein
MEWDIEHLGNDGDDMMDMEWKMAWHNMGWHKCYDTVEITWDLYYAGNNGYAIMDISGNIATSNSSNLTPELVNMMVTLKENISMVDWSIDGNLEEKEEELEIRVQKSLPKQQVLGLLKNVKL